MWQRWTPQDTWAHPLVITISTSQEGGPVTIWDCPQQSLDRSLSDLSLKFNLRLSVAMLEVSVEGETLLAYVT